MSFERHECRSRWQRDVTSALTDMQNHQPEYEMKRRGRMNDARDHNVCDHQCDEAADTAVATMNTYVILRIFDMWLPLTKYCLRNLNKILYASSQLYHNFIRDPQSGGPGPFIHPSHQCPRSKSLAFVLRRR